MQCDISSEVQCLLHVPSYFSISRSGNQKRKKIFGEISDAKDWGAGGGVPTARVSCASTVVRPGPNKADCGWVKVGFSVRGPADQVLSVSHRCKSPRTGHHTVPGLNLEMERALTSGRLDFNGPDGGCIQSPLLSI